MTLSKSQLATLERPLKAHLADVEELQQTLKTLEKTAADREAGKWADPNPKPGHGVAVLADQRRDIEVQIERHLALVRLGRDPRVREALGELLKNPDLVKEAAQDPRAFAAARGIELPPTMDVEIQRDGDGRPHLRLTNYDRTVPFDLTWGPKGLDIRR